MAKASLLKISGLVGVLALLLVVYLVQAHTNIIPFFNQAAQVSSYATYPTLQPLQGLNNPSVAMGLNGVNDWSPAMPFLDLMKYSRKWNGHLTNQYGGYSYDQLVSSGSLDESGWVQSIPSGVSHVGTIWDWADDTYGAASARAGSYVLTYDGSGDIRLNGVRNEVKTPGRITFELSGNGPLSLDIWSVVATNYIRNIVIVKAEYENLVDAGAVFNPAYLDRVKDLRQVRFMDWMETNNSKLQNWSDRRLPTDVTWSEEVPVEIQVRLANEIGADAWFNIPFNATDDFVQKFATYVHDNLDPSLKAYVEFSNEVWNSSFGQSQDAGRLAQSTFKVSEGAGFINYYGKRASEVMKIWTTVYGGDRATRLVRVAATQTANPWISRQILEAPMWQKYLPNSYVAPKTYFDALAVTTYFGGTVVLDPVYRNFMLAEIRKSASGALTVQRAMTAGEMPAYLENSIPEMGKMLDAQKVVASEYKLKLIAYEGGQHEHHSAFISIPEADLNSLQSHLISFVRSSQMATLYDAAWRKWQSVGEGPFMQFSDFYTPNKFGSWGVRASLTDNPPRAQFLDTKNTQTPGWWESRGGSHFQQGRVVMGNGTVAGTNQEDYLIGGSGNDSLYPGPKNDGVYGGAGVDTVLFTGAYSAYTVRANGLGYTIVGPDGSDYLRLVEQASFSDGTLIGLNNGVVTILSRTDTVPTPPAPTVPDAVNKLPQAGSDLYVTEAGAAISQVNVLINDVDADGDTLSVKAFSNKSGGQGGSFTITSAGELTFTPGTTFASLLSTESRETSATYVLTDGKADVTGTVTVTVFGTKKVPPVATTTTPTTNDIDNDTVLDSRDNCVLVKNQAQTDRDTDKIGDACDAVDSRPAPTSTPTPGGAFPLTDDAFFIGHSLVGSTVPTMVKRLVAGASGTGGTAYQVINGAPLRYNWDNSATAEGSDAKTVLPQGNYEAVIITEAIPLVNHTQWNDTNGNAAKFYNLAVGANSKTRTYLYETWHCIASGTAAGCEYDDNDNVAWRTRLNDDRAKWVAIMTAVNQQKKNTDTAMRLIPAGRAMGELADEITAGRVPGITSINQIFKDTIHPNDIGFYFVSLVQYATIYGRSPVGLPAQLQNEWGGNYTAPSATLAAKLQEIAWRVVSTDSLSGVTGGSGGTTTASPRNDDSDTQVNTADNCPFVTNQDQKDTDGDKAGDSCDGTINGETETEMKTKLLGSITSTTPATPTTPVTDYVLKNRKEQTVTNTLVSQTQKVRINKVTNQCDVNSLAFKKESDYTEDQGRSYPIGLFDMSFKCVVPGETITVEIVLDKVYDTSVWELRKYSKSDTTYTTINPSLVTYRTQNNVTVIEYKVTDGGSLDEDGLVNGVIVDPVGPALIEKSVISTPTPTPTPTTDQGTVSTGGGSSGGGGGSSGSGRNTIKNPTTTSVKPATSIPASFTFNKNVSFAQSSSNSVDDVTNLEKFLNAFAGENLIVNGTYEQGDVDAVKRFQKKYRKEILDIWNLGEATGYVGLTTRLKMNFLLKGQSASCPVFTEYNGGTQGIKNSAEIGKTQTILKQLDMYSGAINNTWDTSTNHAMVTFQETFREVMLAPWQLTKGTGYKYKTTNKFLNYFAGCDTGAVDLDGAGTFNF